MAWGLAVVTSSHGGASEFLTSYVNCVLVNPEAVDEISGALSTLVADPDLRLTLGSEARKVAEGFSVEAYIAKVTSLCRAVSHNSQGSSGAVVAATSESLQDS